MKSQKWIGKVAEKSCHYLYVLLRSPGIYCCSIRRVLLFLILLSSCLIIAFIQFRPRINHIKIISHTSPHEPPLCPKMTIHTDNTPDVVFSGSACRPHTTPDDICRYTAKKFAQVPSIEVCKDQTEPYELCHVKEQLVNSTYSSLAVQCNFSLCDREQEIFIEDLHPTSGALRKHNLPGNASDDVLGRLVKDKALSTRDVGDFGFVFLNCMGRKKEKISQLLSLLPPQSVFARQATESTRDKLSTRDKFNVNVILLDSISRAHFYRSLPNTVDFLRKKQSDGHTGGRVFEFELYQAVHGHTHENEHALFSGSLFPTYFTKKQIAQAPTGVEALFGIFSRAGYQTLFQEELCWKGLYGLINSVKAGGRWKTYRKKVKAAHVNSTGISEAVCKLLARYGGSPFYDKGQHQLCFNGRRTHHYLLEYITHYVKEVGRRPRTKPLFAYTAIKVAHDDVGVRVQTLDKDIVEVIKNFLKEENTITIIYADHGNTYTSYQSKAEGRREMYHPMFLVVLPRKMEDTLGEHIVSNLKTNQFRLFNALDMRAGLVALANFNRTSRMAPEGIFGFIPKNRTCDDIEMTRASICLCEDWYQDVKNSTSQLTIAEFAVGQLNNNIQESLLSSRKTGPIRAGSPHIFGACQRLRVEGIGNVQQRTTRRGSVVTTMDVRVQTGNVVKQEERFSIRVERKRDTISTSQEMTLLAFDRSSTYGHHKVCADPSVDLPMCVCNKRAGNQTKKQSVDHVIRTSSNVIKLNSCLLVLHRCIDQKTRGKLRDTDKVDVYDVVNICNDRHFTVTFLNLAKSLNTSAVPVVLKPRTMYFVGSVKSELNSSEKTFVLRMRIATKKEKADKWGDVEFQNRPITEGFVANAKPGGIFSWW